jgi:hypothetical protein
VGQKNLWPPLIEKFESDVEAARLILEPPDDRPVSSGCQRYVTTRDWLPLIAEGWLSLKEGPRKNSHALHSLVTGDSSGIPPSYARLPSPILHASHLIADRFGGLDIYPNLIPFAAEVNQGHWKLFENSLARLVQQERTYLKAFVSRQPGSTQPERIIYHVFQQRASGLQPVLKEYIGFTGFLH